VRQTPAERTEENREVSTFVTHRRCFEKNHRASKTPTVRKQESSLRQKTPTVHKNRTPFGLGFSVAVVAGASLVVFFSLSLLSSNLCSFSFLFHSLRHPVPILPRVLIVPIVRTPFPKDAWGDCHPPPPVLLEYHKISKIPMIPKDFK
jgi:hypothetical protein